YDTSGNEIETKTNKWVNGQWQMTNKYTRVFDANNNIAFFQTNWYNNAPGTADSSRFIYYYSGKVYDSSVYQIYNMGWRDTSKQVFEHVSANYSIQWGLQKKNTVWDTV